MKISHPPFQAQPPPPPPAGQRSRLRPRCVQVGEPAGLPEESSLVFMTDDSSRLHDLKTDEDVKMKTENILQNSFNRSHLRWRIVVQKGVTYLIVHVVDGLDSCVLERAEEEQILHLTFTVYAKSSLLNKSFWGLKIKIECVGEGNMQSRFSWFTSELGHCRCFVTCSFLEIFGVHLSGLQVFKIQRNLNQKSVQQLMNSGWLWLAVTWDTPCQ